DRAPAAVGVVPAGNAYSVRAGNGHGPESAGAADDGTDTGRPALGYDYLIYALGSFVRTDGLPGAREHAYTVDRASAQALAAQLPSATRRGGRLLVVGGGNTGVEVATEVAESNPGLHVTLATRRSFASQVSPNTPRHRIITGNLAGKSRE